MLQQTQVDRVVPKFLAFIKRFPDEKSLAEAELGDVLSLWSGLGYNRRAKFLHQAAKKIMEEYEGVFPETEEALRSLSGVGPGTAGAIMAYAFNQPVVFIETNVRTVYFHHFFQDKMDVRDAELVPLIQQTMDKAHVREFYWALMDYGVWLKKEGLGRISQSRHYKKQTPLRGSVREVRGKIIKTLTAKQVAVSVLREEIDGDERFEPALDGLVRDGLVTRSGEQVYLTK